MATLPFLAEVKPEINGAEEYRRQEGEVCTSNPILFASDFSDPASYPVRYVNALAKALGSSVFFEYLPGPEACFPKSDGGNGETAETGSNAPVVARVHDAIQLEEMLSLLDSIIRKHHPSMLVVGSRSESESDRALLARLARRLGFRSGVPVLIVGKPDEVAVRKAGQWQKILAATDLNSPANTGLLHAHTLAGSQLIALHCIDSKDMVKAHHKLAHLRMLAPFNESHTVPVRHIVRAGETTETILTVADETKPDLIVLGSPTPSREHAGNDESVVCRVVSTVSCPVLLMPPRAGEGGDHRR
ncbi:universal stress protein [Silvibacterium acidisoli]|uniref:universal stress protein n=1 Tax=Acidobacteriaceae bacterium ZG23-2 TaxID=2883246 RepID=UPI00406C80E0